MKILVTIEKRIIHKAVNRSRLHDDAPINKRTATCGSIVDNIDVNASWKKVNCERCLSHKIKE